MPKLTAVVIRNFEIPGDADGASIKIKHLKPGEIQKIEADFIDWIGKASSDDSFVTEMKLNPTMQARAIRTASVVGWKGFKGLQDEVLECNRTNVSLYLDEDPLLGDGDDAKTFTAWIDHFRKILIDEEAAKQEKVEKN